MKQTVRVFGLFMLAASLLVSDASYGQSNSRAHWVTGYVTAWDLNMTSIAGGGSAVIAKGTSVGLTVDIDGVTVGARPNIGAYETVNPTYRVVCRKTQ
jgi:hypothetical protein